MARHYNAPILNFVYKHDRSPVDVLLIENPMTIKTMFNILASFAAEHHIAHSQGMPIEYAKNDKDEIIGMRVGRFHLELIDFDVTEQE